MARSSFLSDFNYISLPAGSLKIQDRNESAKRSWNFSEEFAVASKTLLRIEDLSSSCSAALASFGTDLGNDLSLALDHLTFSVLSRQRRIVSILI